VQQAVRELTVVGQEECSARVKVEAPDGHHSSLHPLHVLGDGGAPLRILHGAHDVPRLVKHQVHRSLGGHAAAVHLDDILLRIRACSELRDDLAVHRDAPCGDERFGVSSRRDARLREELLQAFRGHAGALSKAPGFG
jgi:hypothetical protein